MASSLRKPLYMDLVIEERPHLEFARVFVEMNVDSYFPDFIDFKMPNWEIMKFCMEFS